MTASLTGGSVVEKAWLTCKVLLADELSVGGSDWQRIESTLNAIGRHLGLPQQELRRKLLDDPFLRLLAGKCGKNLQTADAVCRFVLTQLAEGGNPAIGQAPLLYRFIALAIAASNPLAVVPRVLSVAAERLPPDQFAMLCLQLAPPTLPRRHVPLLPKGWFRRSMVQRSAIVRRFVAKSQRLTAVGSYSANLTAA